MTDSLRARILINLSAVLYEQSAARPSLPAEVGNMDLDFVLSVAFISDVYIADSLRARTPINLSAVLYEQAAARTGLPAEVSNMDLNFVPSVAFISDVHIADSLRARTLINLSAVLYEQAAARTGLSAEVSNISPRARTLINLSAVLYEQVGIMDLNFVPGVAFDAIGNVELTGDLLGDADRVNNNNNNVAPTLQFSLTALLNPQLLASKRPALSSSDLDRGPSLAKRIKTDEDCKKSTHRDDDDVQLVRDNIEELISGNNRNNLNIMVTDPTSREFGRVDIKSSTRLCLLIDRAKANGLIWILYCKQKWAYNISKFYKGKNIQLLRPQGLTPGELGSIYVLRSVDKIRANVADVFDTVVSKLDKVPTREPSSYIKTELLCDNSRKFYRLVITSEDTHCKQTIKKAYIMLLERASLILFMT
ncbi:hypothetical protein HBI74_184050 [Parastagonospora nodorum]|nr:hypothetical protein HBI74_184050 [Parastagonospora nodorum]